MIKRVRKKNRVGVSEGYAFREVHHVGEIDVKADGVLDVAGIRLSFLRCRGQHGLEFGFESMDVVCSVLEFICELLDRRSPFRSLSFATAPQRKAVLFLCLYRIRRRGDLLLESLCVFVNVRSKRL